MINAFCISTNNVDVYPDLKKVYAGGIAINVASYLVRDGHKASYCGWVGNDPMGILQMDALKKENVDTTHTKMIDMQQDWCSIKLEENGNRVFQNGDAQISSTHKFTVEDVEKGFNGQYDVIYTNIECDFEEDAWKRLGESDIPVAYDYSNYWDRFEQDRISMSKGVVDYFYMSLEGRQEDPEEFLKKCVNEYGAKIALGTLGTKGSILYNGRKIYQQKAYLVDAVDTMGAGDMFLSSFTSTYVEGMKKLRSCAQSIGWKEDDAHYLDCEDMIIRQSLNYAAMKSAENCMHQGALGHEIDFTEDMLERSIGSKYRYE